MLSVLLGSHPPQLSAAHLIAVGSLFGFTAGSVRTALSRMTSNGELTLETGKYRLGQRMLDRQRVQDSGRTSTPGAWSGDWILATVLVERRSVAERRAFRTAMTSARMGELRPDTWLRPANISAPSPGPEFIVTTGTTQVDDAPGLAARLWPLEHYDQHTAVLLDELAATIGLLDSGDPSAIPATFHLSAEVVRFLRIEPQLPLELHPASAQVHELRRAYDEYELKFRALLRSFLLSQTADD
jgi:phenylacetic acid degradation operon negative regulatory protein